MSDIVSDDLDIEEIITPDVDGERLSKALRTSVQSNWMVEQLDIKMEQSKKTSTMIPALRARFDRALLPASFYKKIYSAFVVKRETMGSLESLVRRVNDWDSTPRVKL